LDILPGKNIAAIKKDLIINSSESLIREDEHENLEQGLIQPENKAKPN